MKAVGVVVLPFLSMLSRNIETTTATATATATSTTDKSGNNQLRHRNRLRRRIKEKDNDGDCSAALPRDGMSPSDVKRSATAAKMSYLVYKLGEGTLAAEDEAISELLGGSYGAYYESGIDAVYNARIGNDYCVVAFRGTFDQQEEWRKDAMSNFLVDPVEFHSEGSALCDIHGGFHASYFQFEHRSAGIVDFLETCRSDCPSCEVLLTGHSQGGAIAEVAAFYYLGVNGNGNEEKTEKKTEEEAALEPKVHVVTFGSPQALGAGCLPLFTKEERCRFSHYVMTIEGTLGTGLTYDPIPMVYPRALGDLDNDGEMNSYMDSYARHGGLAFVGFEIFLNSLDPSSVFLGGFDDHYSVATSRLDWTTDSHDKKLYAEVLAKQAELYSSSGDARTECYLPTDGFSLGSFRVLGGGGGLRSIDARRSVNRSSVMKDFVTSIHSNGHLFCVMAKETKRWAKTTRIYVYLSRTIGISFTAYSVSFDQMKDAGLFYSTQIPVKLGMMEVGKV
eukprot:jgi/Psemu1/16292/gm1.16292_g